MGRWQPNARGRLEEAALELFLERGYEATTVADIAQRAGLTERTFFRRFADKREVLFGDPSAYFGTFTEAIATAPIDAVPMDAVATALRASAAFFAGMRDRARQRQSVIDANPALQEREQIKRLHLTETIAEALGDRGVADTTARLSAELGTVAFYQAFSRWLAAPEEADLGRLAIEVLDELRAVAR